MVGIVGYGAYVPCYRVRTDAIAAQWCRAKGMSLVEKTVPGMDEDALTISVEAARRAVARSGVDPAQIGAVYVGSESHPYAVKPTGTIVVDALGIGPHVHVADFEFACKAGTEALYCAYSHVKAGEMPYALAIGADTSQGAPGDALEYTASAGGAAFVLGSGDAVLAEVLFTHSVTTDTPDFWRREGEFYPSHGGRFTGEPAYFRHIVESGKAVMQKACFKPADFDHVVLHMPNDKFPERAAKLLGFGKEQIEAGFLVREMGNTYAGSSPLGLCAVLDVANAGDRILVVSFGSGAGSDAFVLRATAALEKARPRAPTVRADLDGRRIYLDYARYALHRGKLILRD
jgi:hydroxymethylglutaryl-CoA synthase